MIQCKVLTHVDHARLLRVTRDMRAIGNPYRDMAAELEGELHPAIKMDGEQIPPELVTMNSTVRIRDLRTRRAEELTIVYPQEADLLRGRISVIAPLGKALLGSRVGDTIVLRVPAGRRQLYVEAMLYQPEAAGQPAV